LDRNISIIFERIKIVIKTCLQRAVWRNGGSNSAESAVRT